MKAILLSLAIPLLMVGCGEQAQKEAVLGEAKEESKDDPSVPLAIPCVACREKVSKKIKECRQCGHPTPDSVVAYKEAQEFARIRAEEDRELELAERRRAEEEAKAQAKHIALEDHTIILNAVRPDSKGYNYTGWVKAEHDNGQINYLGQFMKGKKDGQAVFFCENGYMQLENYYKDGELDGLSTSWHVNGQKSSEVYYKDGKKDGLTTSWYENGRKRFEANFKDGKENGLFIHYNKDGTEKMRYTFKDGEPFKY